VLDRTFSGIQSFDAAMSEYQHARTGKGDVRIHPSACDAGTPAAGNAAALPRDSRQPKAMDGFAQMNAGTVSPAEFFAPENVNAITAVAYADPPG
jgi:hypothetical protein